MGFSASSLGEAMSMNVSGWSLRPTEWGDELNRVIRLFLICSPAYDVTHMAQSFIESMNITKSAVAEQFVEEMKKELGVSIDFCDDALEVERHIEGFADDPWDSESEYLVCVRSKKESLTNAVKQATDYGRDAANQLEKKANENILRRFYEVDAVYRHLRNGLAHGCFRLVERGGNQYLFFFNVNEGGNVSACGLLSFEHLDCLYQLGCTVAKREL